MRMVARWLVLLPLLWVEGVRAVDCQEAFYYLNTQADVDALGATGCDSVSGYLHIQGTDVTNLDGLANITSVGGYLTINDSDGLTNLDGLDNVTSVGGALNISDNAALADIDGFAGLTSVGGQLQIMSNDALANLDGLAHLANVGDGFFIERNDALTNIDGPASLTSVGGNLSIATNATLTSINGLANLTSVGGGINISDNAALADIDGFAGLTSVGDYLYITDNAALTNVDGLINVTSLGILHIGNNDALTSLDGLAGVTNVGGDLYVGYNASLIDVDGLVNVAAVGGALRIPNNHALIHLDGLAGITSVGDDLRIESNPKLASVDGLVSLTTVGNLLTIISNPMLASLDGLASLASVGDRLVIDDNDALSRISGFPNLSSVGENLHIIGNTALERIDGLNALINIDGSLQIDGNNALLSVTGLNALIKIAVEANISNNSNLLSLEGLSSLAEVSGRLRLYGNHSLESLAAMESVIKLGSLELVNNFSLTECGQLAVVLGWPNGPPDDEVDGSILVGSNNGVGCSSVAQIISSVSGPTQPVITQATTSSNSISLAFNPSTTTDTLFPITDYSASCTGSDVDASGSPATDLLDNTPIQETLTVSGYDPTAVMSSIEVDIDITHSDPTDLYITLTTPEGTELILWNQGSNGGENLAGTFPTTLSPIDPISTVSGEAMDDDWVLRVEDIDVGPLVREGVLNSWGLRISEEITTTGSTSPITISNATRGRDYSCTVAPITGLGVLPVSEAIMVNVPLELPATPTITSTDYEDGKIILTVSVSDNGGTDITGYEATCTDGTNSFIGTGTSSPITVSGLTNEVAYTCTVTATNSVGTSSASAATDPIIPEEIVNALPIWLLYQATQ